MSFLSALVGFVKNGDAQEFWQQYHLDSLAGFGLGCSRSGRSGCVTDVIFIVDGEGAHHDAQAVLAGGVLLDGVSTHASSFEFLASDTLQLTIRDQIGGIVADITEVDEAPQGELGSAAVLGVGSHFGGQTQTGNLDLVTQFLVLHGLGGGDDTNGGGGHDQFHIRIFVNQRQRLLVGGFRLVVAINNIQQFQLGVLGILEGFLHGSDPGILIGGIGGS